VTVPSFEPWMVQALLPEMLLLALALLVLLVDAIWHGRSRTWLGWFTAIGLVVTLVLGVVFSRPQADQAMIFGGMLRDDWLAFTFRVLFLFSAAITALLSTGVQGIRQRGEFYALLVIATLGMNLMAAASDLVMLYLAIETTSIPLYVLAGFLKQDNKSTESGLKYFLFGALTSTVMLYGFSLLYGLAGATNLYVLAEQFRAGAVSAWVLAGTVILVLVGFGFKISMVPFHFWSPDVYEGAPTPITAFVSTASKAAGFAVLVRVLLAAFPDVQAYWVPALSVLAVLTMTLGNLLALAQTNIKRLLAYSSIAHAGYVMIGLVSLSVFGVTSVVFYLAAYMVSNLAAFAVVILFSRAAGSEEIKDYAGLSRRSPGLALVLLVALLSLAGMPPLAGFVGKVYVFAAAVESGLIWLAFVGVINAIIGLYYYLTVLKVVYLYRSEHEDKPVAVPRTYALALIVCVLAILLIGTLSAPWLGWASQAASSLF
jgi:NADH-quinone oxidoreductase subunit N